MNTNTVQNIIYSFWVDDNPLTPNRIKCLDEMKKNIDVNICLITKDNLCDFILDDFPLHPSYKHLSRVHKSDYLRCYFMHHYGGGYSDIKKQNHSWKEYFDIINSNPDIWEVGLGGFDPPDKAFKIPYISPYIRNDMVQGYDMDMYMNLKRNHHLLVGVGFFIFRPYTKYTQEWYNKVHELLDYYYPTLKSHPAVFTRESFDRPPKMYWDEETDPVLMKLPCPTERTKYPLVWTRLLGQIVYPIQLKYIQHVRNGLPMPDFKDYM